jgi:hypothetical protein
MARDRPRAPVPDPTTRPGGLESMQLPSVRSILRLGIGLLAPVVFAAALAGPGFGATTLDPEKVQVQYLPQDGAAMVLWNAVDNAMGYNVYEQTVTKPGNPSTATAATLLNKAPITTTSLLVDKLTNGTSYHFTITAIVGGQESAPVGPRPAIAGTQGQQEEGDLVAVVPQKPVTLGGRDGFFGLNIGTDFPGSHTVDDQTGTITMMASGWDIQSGADGEYFLAVPAKGDVTVTARCVSGPTETADESAWSLGGVQIRGSLDAGSVLAMTQVAHSGTAQFKYRDLYGNSPAEEHEDSSADPTRRPLWVRIVRKGNTLSGYLSDDGKTWNLLNSQGGDGTHLIMDMPETAYVGLALAARYDSEYTTAVFDQFTITSP